MRLSFFRISSRLLAAAEGPLKPTGSNVLTLYRYQICPFCSKVETLLRYHSLPFDAVEVNPLGKPELKWSQEYRKVPIAVFGDGTVVPDSNRIIDHLLTDTSSPLAGRVKPEFYDAEAQQWRQWADSSLAPIVYPNITRSVGEARETLEYTRTAFPPMQSFLIRHVGSLGMAMAHSKILKKYNITAGGEREALWGRLDSWAQELAMRGTPFAGGSDPSLADIVVFGVIATTRGLPLYHEISEGAPEEQLPPGHVVALRTWLQRMNALVPAAAR
eukprot:TRINITY_DN33529_c0_g1_i1.p1 TRINITY_DN33529_c0_g1~~TRINITY_DN33529_c0_g1_i1.p1  ORF type:complete len:273 (-),score=46.33 TRINITY_DN33529_c0_g1_i1:101-919(-)